MIPPSESGEVGDSTLLSPGRRATPTKLKYLLKKGERGYKRCSLQTPPAVHAPRYSI